MISTLQAEDLRSRSVTCHGDRCVRPDTWMRQSIVALGLMQQSVTPGRFMVEYPIAVIGSGADPAAVKDHGKGGQLEKRPAAWEDPID